ncbi:MAG: glutamine--fructose-6-phosphate transaminase (isomerizing) [Patescibacteria group bacterium]
MCGITGYIGPKDGLSTALKCLHDLEYRGYDSAGVVFFNADGQLRLIKSVGKLIHLDEKIKDLKAQHKKVAIAHTRWATHGIPNETNAHPHHDCLNNIFVVHNGIIENYRELKAELIKKGHKFYSQTDTEIAAHLIEEKLKKENNFFSAFKLALKEIRGAYAFAVINKNEPDILYIARLGSPLIVGIGGSTSSPLHEYFVVSDPAALAGLAKKVIYLKDGQVGRLSLSGFEIGPARPHIEHLDLSPEQAQKGNFPHFMLKEINDIPNVIRDSLLGRLLPEKNLIKLGGLDMIYKKLKNIRRLEIVACGTSYYAGMVGEMLFEEIADLPVELTIASEFRYRKNSLRRDTGYLFISQSGETADTLAALKKINAKKLLSLGIVNVVGSSIARETKAGVYNRAGAEIGVASTKAFLSQLIILTMMALYMANNKSSPFKKDLINELGHISEKIKLVLRQSELIKKIAIKYQPYKNFLYLGRGYNYPTALEGALKIKELSYVHAEGYAGGEMKHGPLALIDADFPTIAVVTQNSIYEKMLSNLEEIKARGGKIIAIATKGDKMISKIADDVIFVPATLEPLEPMVNIIPLQLLAYHSGVLKGYDVDKPRNLAKSVTVE